MRKVLVTVPIQSSSSKWTVLKPTDYLSSQAILGEGIKFAEVLAVL
jgi:hypothetical protein